MDGWDGRRPVRPHQRERGGVMRTHQLLAPVLMLLVSAPAAAQDQVPTAFRSLKPYQIVEAMAAERSLDLTAVQGRRLDSLRLAIRGEPHRYEGAPSPKAHQNVRMQPMISRQEAYADALAILTPAQRSRARARFGDPEYRLPKELRQTHAAPNRPGEPLRRHAPGATPGRRERQAGGFDEGPAPASWWRGAAGRGRREREADQPGNPPRMTSIQCTAMAAAGDVPAALRKRPQSAATCLNAS